MGIIPGKLIFTETDGTPTAYPYKMKLPSGILTDNGDGTVNLSIIRGVNVATITVSETEPADPQYGDLWVELG